MAKICNFNDYCNGRGNGEERKNFANFVGDGISYGRYISSLAKEVHESIKNSIDEAYIFGNPNVIPLVNRIQKENSNNKVIDLNNEKVLKLQKSSDFRAGFVQASILFYAVFLTGIITAIILIIL